MRDQRAILAVFILWILLGVAGFSLFYVSRNVAFKRKYFPWYVALVGALFLGFAAAVGIPVPVLAVMTPVVALIAYLNLRATQFCSSCGRTIIQQMFFSRPEFCSKCGALLRDPDGASGRP